MLRTPIPCEDALEEQPESPWTLDLHYGAWYLAKHPEGYSGVTESPRGAPQQLRIEDVPSASRYEARLGDELAGWVDYRRVRTRFVAIHTEVLPAFGGRGIGSALVRRVIADARAAGERISPICPLFATHFERHPEDRDVLAVRIDRGGGSAGSRERDGG